MKKNKFWKKIDILFLVLLPITATFLSLFTKANLFLSSIFFYGLPSIYFSFRNSHAIKRTLLFTFVFGLPAAIVVDHAAHFSDVWFVPTIFPRIFGLATWEAVFWALCWIYAITIFYEHFLDKGRHNPFDKRMKNLVTIMIIAMALYVLVWLGKPGWQFPFPYASFGFVFLVVPIVLFLGMFPKLISKYVKIAVYFGILGFINELTSLSLGNWYWPNSQFIGWMQFGSHRFPFEEFIYYILLGSVAILCYFEYFDDEHLKREARRYT